MSARAARRIIGMCAGLSLVLMGCTANPSTSVDREDPTQPPPIFEDVTARSGVRFVHQQADYILNVPETMSPGVAVLDLDGDGLHDLFLLQGSGPGNGRLPSLIPVSEVYRKHGDGTWQEVGKLAGIQLSSWGMGCLATDLDNDGYVDLLVTAIGGTNHAYRNNGDGTFRDGTQELGLGGPGRFASFITALDYDRDGLQDLYLGHYVIYGPSDWVWDLRSSQLNYMRHTLFPVSMAPQPYKAEEKILYHSRLPAPYEDATRAAGVADPRGKGLGGLGGDFDRDGWPDIFVANDTTPSTVFRNLHNGKFDDMGERAYVAARRGSMGLALGDVQGDGAMDVIVTRWWHETTALYINMTRPQARKGALAFMDRGQQFGLAEADTNNVGWATAFLDYDNDGLEDLFILNGDTNHDVKRIGKMAPQKPVLFRHTEPSRFVPLTPRGEQDPLNRAIVGRGAAFGDLDRNGTTDVVVVGNNEPAGIWVARSQGGRWLAVELCGTSSNRDALGTRVEIRYAGRRHARELVAGESYLSSNARQLLFGVGAHDKAIEVDVSWPSGRKETFRCSGPDVYLRLVECTGNPLDESGAR